MKTKTKGFNSPDCGNRCSNLLLCDYTGNQHSLYRYVGSSIISNRNSFNCETPFFMDSEILRKFVSAI